MFGPSLARLTKNSALPVLREVKIALGTHSAHLCTVRTSTPFLESPLPFHRQLPLSLRLCLWSWLLCHRGGLPGGCGKDPIHECPPRQVLQPFSLYVEDGGPGGTHGLLQRVSCRLLPPALFPENLGSISLHLLFFPPSPPFLSV